MFVEPRLFSKEWNARTARLPFLRAVLAVFHEIRDQDRNPSASYWTTNHAFLREHAMPRIVVDWSHATKLDPSMFPWTLDEVATTWEEWRKTNAQYREQYCREVGLDLLAAEYARKAREKDPG